MIKAINKVSHNGTVYDHGDEIPNLTQSEAERLLDLGSAEGEGETSFELETDLGGPITSDLTTPDEFGKMNAPEQKELLDSLLILPADKKEDRIVQYEEWYAEQVKGDPNA